MTQNEKMFKRLFDVFFSFFGLVFFGWFILVLALVSKIVVKGRGIFRQLRVGENGKLFTMYKIETIYKGAKMNNTFYMEKFFQTIRKFKLDELPQLWNVLEGTMSFVGPRPDILGFADQLKGEDRIILDVKPGITGPATILFRNEEELLLKQENPKKYNEEVIWPMKIALNVKYIKDYSFRKDLLYIMKTFFP